MKSLLTLLLIITSTLNAKDISTNDIKQLFQGEKVFMETNMEQMRNVSFSTNSEFHDAKAKLKAFLGNNWEEQKMDKKVKQEVDNGLASSGQKFNGMIIFNKKDQPTNMITISHMNMKMEGKKYLLQIMIMNSK